MPFPSTGCQPCRTRRIKCDGIQPVCRRCSKAEIVCYGAREAFSVVHTENPYASGQKKRPRGPRALPKSKRIEPATKVHLSTPPTLFDIPKVAFDYFVRCHMERVENSPSLLKHAYDDLLPALTSIKDCKILDLALGSLSMALFSRTQCLPQAQVEAFRKYQELLQILRNTIPNLHSGNFESCLLVILLMILYEDAIYRHNGSPPKASPSSFHFDGVIAMLKLWRHQAVPGVPVANVVKSARRVVLKWKLMVMSGPVPEWMHDGASFGEEGFDLEYDTIVVRTLDIRHAVTTLEQDNVNEQPPATKVEALNTEAQDIDRALQDWIRHFPSEWCYHRHTLPNAHLLSKQHFYSPEVFSYRSPAYSAIWLRYYQNRMLVNSARLRVLQLRAKSHKSCDTQAQESDCMSRIKATVDELASAIPFCLERFKIEEGPNSEGPTIVMSTKDETQANVAGLIIPALSVASMLRHTPADQKSWFKSQLLYIGKLTGFGLLEAVGRDGWIEL